MEQTDTTQYAIKRLEWTGPHPMGWGADRGDYYLKARPLSGFYYSTIKLHGEFSWKCCNDSCRIAEGVADSMIGAKEAANQHWIDTLLKTVLEPAAQPR